MVGVSSQAGLWGEHYSKHGWEGLGLLERSWDRTALGSREGLERESEGRPALPEEGGLCGCSQEEMELSVQFSSVAQSCPTLCDPMNRSTPGLPVHHQLPEFTQTHVHQVSDAIQPSHPLSSPSSPAPNPSQHQGLFQ